jgi:hypothetical protein
MTLSNSRISGLTNTMAMEGHRGLLPTGFGIGGYAWQGSQADIGGWRKSIAQQTLEIPRDSSVATHPIRSPEAARIETRPRSPRTDPQR